MPRYDFRCTEGHVHDDIVPYAERENQVCPECGNPAKIVWLTAPQLDWAKMAMGANAGPEFVDRFERSHKKRREQERKHKQEHGDNMRGAGG